MRLPAPRTLPARASLRPRLAPLAAVLLLPLAACSCSGWSSYARTGIEGSGVAAEERRELAGFSRIETRAALDLRVAIGPESSVRLVMDDNLLPHFRSEVSGATLELGFEPGSYHTETDVVAYVTTPHLEHLAIRGSADAELEGLAGDRFEVEIQGSGDVRAAGHVDEAHVAVRGSGDVDLQGLEARRASVSIRGSGDVVLRASEALEVEVSGSGDVRYLGSPTVTQRVAGSGSITPL